MSSLLVTDHLIQVYQFEKNWMTALKSVLSFADTQVETFSDGGDIAALPRIEIDFTLTDTDQQMVKIPLEEPKAFYSARYQGVIALSIHSRRKESLQHHQRIGEARLQMSYIKRSLSGSILPFYQIQWIVEQQSENGISSDQDDEIVTRLNYNTQFQIIPSAWLSPLELTFEGDKLTFENDILTFKPS